MLNFVNKAQVKNTDALRNVFLRYNRKDTITDLVLLVLRTLRRDLSKLTGSMELVDLYNEG